MKDDQDKDVREVKVLEAIAVVGVLYLVGLASGIAIGWAIWS